MNKQQEKILAGLDMGEDKQRDFVRNILIDIYYSNWMLDQWDKGRFSLADLAFRLSGGKIAGKKPIGYIIDALLAKESK